MLCAYILVNAAFYRLLTFAKTSGKSLQNHVINRVKNS